MDAKDYLILQEFVSRKLSLQGKDPFRLRDPDFLKQNAVLDAREHRFKAINCTRRSGKSVGEAIDHFEVCEQFPNSRNLYFGITLDSVTEIVWDIFKELSRIGNYNCRFNETKKIVHFPNGSRIRLVGLDVSEKQIRKILGQKIRKVSIDEAGSITQDMKKICYQMIMPALSDLRPNSWLTLLGTCENIPNTFFEKVTEGHERMVDWRVFKWTAYDNPHMKKQWTDEIEELTKNNPLIVEASWFKTHYLNQWCTDDELRIIHYAPERNLIKAIPSRRMNYVLGVDLGFNDATAFSLLAFDYKDNKKRVVKSYKDTQMDFTDVANEVKKLQTQFSINKIIVDGANKQGIEELRRRHGLSLHSAEKQDKATFLRILDDEVKTGLVEVLDGQCHDLENEWDALMWKNEDKQEEDPRCQNHLSDATLYAWRECRNYVPDDDEIKDPNRTRYMDDLEKREAEELEEQIKEDEQWEMW